MNLEMILEKEEELQFDHFSTTSLMVRAACKERAPVPVLGIKQMWVCVHLCHFLADPE